MIDFISVVDGSEYSGKYPEVVTAIFSERNGNVFTTRSENAKKGDNNYAKVLANYMLHRGYILKNKASVKGGEGSGNFDHAGRPGKVGGSARADGLSLGVSEVKEAKERVLTASMRLAKIKKKLNSLYQPFKDAEENRNNLSSICLQIERSAHELKGFDEGLYKREIEKLNRYKDSLDKAESEFSEISLKVGALEKERFEILSKGSLSNDIDDVMAYEMENAEKARQAILAGSPVYEQYKNEYIKRTELYKKAKEDFDKLYKYSDSEDDPTGEKLEKAHKRMLNAEKRMIDASNKLINYTENLWNIESVVKENILQTPGEKFSSKIKKTVAYVSEEMAYESYGERPVVDSIKRGEKYFMELVGNQPIMKESKVEYQIISGEYVRASCSDVDKVKNVITLGNNSSYTTVAHELGHALEQNDGFIRKLCLNFYKKRTESEEKIPLSEVTGSKYYESYEYTKKDRFIDPYMGKIYESSFDTEILSQGLSFFSTNSNITRLAEEDPEYFNFIYAVLRLYG